MECAGTLKTDQEVFEASDEYLANHYARLRGVNFVSGEGVWLYDSKGRPILDMVAQYSAAGFGRGYKRQLSYPFFNEVMDALIKEQTHGCGMLPGSCYNPTVAYCAKSLCEFTGMDKVIFMNSGAEAFDTAVKIIRKFAFEKRGIPEESGLILVTSKNFHGRTLGAISASDTEQYRKGFGPLLPGFGWVGFGNTASLEGIFELETLQLRRVIAFITEPVQGEGGVHVPPDGYLRKAKKICHKHDALFVLDEVQTGFGRTGYKFAWENDGPEAGPDLMMLGKMMCGGVFVGSAVAGRSNVMSILRPGDHGSTFGGVPAACAVTAKVIEIFNKNPELIDHVRETGKYFLENLEIIAERTGNPLIKEIRGRGLLIGVEFSQKLASFFMDKLLENKILAGVAGYGYVLRFSPSLTITKREIDWALPRIEKVLKRGAR